MELEDSDIILIQRYFDLQLSEEELHGFEQRLNSDEAFSEKVGLYQSSLEVVETHVVDFDQEQRDKHWRAVISQNSEPLKPTKITRRKWLTGIAASVIVLLSIWQFGIPKNQLDLDASLEAAWAKKVGLDFVVRNNQNTTDVPLLNALSAYEQNNSSDALQWLKAYDHTFSRYHDVLILRALANHKLQRTSIALKTLDTLEPYNSAVAKWYKGLIYLSNDDIDNAKIYLQLPKTDDEVIQLK